MPEYLKRTGRDVTDDILVRVPEAEKKVARLRGPANKRLGIDRGNIPDVAAPLEGQMMIQYADEAVGATPVSPDVGSTFVGEQPYYYANGEWRPFFTGYSPNSVEEHLHVASVSCAAIDTTTFTWVHYDGATILDVSSPTAPAVAGRGVYVVNAAATIFLPAVEPAGDAFDVRLEAIQVAPAWPPSTPTPGLSTAIASGDTFEVIQWSTCVAAVMNAGDYYTFSMFNRSSYAVDFVAGISVVRVFAF
jgi:hypothetical protein